MRTPLGTSTEPGTCGPKRPSCDHWVLGADHLIASASPTEQFSVGAAVATDCGVLLSWQRITLGPPLTTSREETTRLAPDGSRTSDLNHTTFPDGPGGDQIWLAALGSRIAEVHGYQRCLFVRLDSDGRNDGPILQSPDIVSSCMDLAATADGFSFVAPLSNGDLFSLDAAGAIVTRTALNVPSTRNLLGRTMLDDGSFILNSFAQTPVAPPSAPVQYSSWLRHFDSRGVPLADEVEIDWIAAPLQVTQSGLGLLLVAQHWGSLDVLATNPDGVPTGQRVHVPLPAPSYERSLVALPNGDVMALSMDNEFNLTAHQLAPSGTPRDLGLTLPFRPAPNFMSVVSPNGDLLIAYVDINAHDVRVQSLTCVP